MNAIKLPVRFEQENPILGSWHVMDAERTVFVPRLSKEEAAQIVTALNSHDALVEAVKFYSEIRDEIGDIARTALAKVEDLRKKS